MSENNIVEGWMNVKYCKMLWFNFSEAFLGSNLRLTQLKCVWHLLSWNRCKAALLVTHARFTFKVRWLENLINAVDVPLDLCQTEADTYWGGSLVRIWNKGRAKGSRFKLPRKNNTYPVFHTLVSVICYLTHYGQGSWKKEDPNI